MNTIELEIGAREKSIDVAKDFCETAQIDDGEICYRRKYALHYYGTPYLEIYHKPNS